METSACNGLSPDDSLDTRYEVVIIGAGPSGLVLAQWMASKGIRTLLVDKEDRKNKLGRADGLEPRSLEILDSFGLADQTWAESVPTIEFCYWTLNGIIPEALSINHDELESGTTFPISLQLKQTSSKFLARTEVGKALNVKTKYVVGCDGGHSWTRAQMEGHMEGTRSGSTWGAIDVLPITDFSDIRCRCIMSTQLGTMLIIPRERNLVRMHVLIIENGPEKSQLDDQDILEAAQDIMKPYTLTPAWVEWWTIYEVAQALADRYSFHRRVFLAGDAVHVHSPKAGQGMNVSMQDSYNLGWKLAQVLKGVSRPELLDTYEAERRPIAQTLLQFDSRFNEIFEKPDDSWNGANERLGKTLKGVTEEHDDMSPLSTSYFRSIFEHLQRASNDTDALCKNLANPPLEAPSIEIGHRLPDVNVVRHADARTLPILELLPANGRWRLLIFIGDTSQSRTIERLQELAKRVSESVWMGPPHPKAWPESTQWVNLAEQVEMVLCHSAPRNEVDILSLPELFHPTDKNGGMDYNKVFCDDPAYDESAGHAYTKYSVDPGQGSLIPIRPDQVVAWVCQVDELEELERVMVASFCAPTSFACRLAFAPHA